MTRSDAVGYGTSGAAVALVALGFVVGALVARNPAELAAGLLACTVLVGLVLAAGFWLAGRLHDGE